jgi:DNA-binding protein HU-beta
MNKGELIEAVAKDAGISKALAGKVLDSAIDAITKSLSKGDRVALVGFGTFSVSARKARSGRNPQTGKEIRIPATKVAKFKAGNKLVKAVK